MKLKLVIDKLDDVEEKYRDLYIEKDGKFVLDAEEPDNSKLVSALQKERKNNKELDAKMKAFEALGKTPEEIAELISKMSEIEEGNLVNKGEWEKLRQQMLEKHNIELGKKDRVLKEKDDALSMMQRTLESHLIDAQATAAIAKEKGVPTLLLPHLRTRMKVIKDGDAYKVQIVDEKGEPRVNGKGEPLSADELVAEMKTNEIFGRAFEASGHSGGGMPPGPGGNNNGSGRVPAGTKKSDLKTPRQRADFVDQHGLEAYQSLPA